MQQNGPEKGFRIFSNSKQRKKNSHHITFLANDSRPGVHDVTATDDGTGVINFGDEDIDAVLQQEQGGGGDPGQDQIKINRVTHHPPPPPLPPQPADEGWDLCFPQAF